MRPFIFTEAFNCGRITKVSVESFLKYHKQHNVHLFGTEKDFKELGEVALDPRVILYDFSNDSDLLEMYKKGHDGTAEIFARVLSGDYHNIKEKISAANTNEDITFIHFDGDVIFKQECISLMESLFYIGYDLIGTRRCYKNNPAGIPVPDVADTISTYFMGIKKSSVPDVKRSELKDMCKGSYNPLGHMVFDFFDPVTFVCMKNGFNVFYLDNVLFGGQDESGSKKTKYQSNMHLDMGMYLAHFGGVGSGYAWLNDPSEKAKEYGSWAAGRYALFAKLFLNENIDIAESCKIDGGRWVSGTYNDEILNLVKQEMNK